MTIKELMEKIKKSNLETEAKTELIDLMKMFIELIKRR